MTTANRWAAALVVAGILVLAATSHVATQVLDTQQVTANSSGGGCTAVANSCAVFQVGPSPTVTLQVSGTYTGTLTFEGTADGTNWKSVAMTDVSAGTTTTTTTTTGQYATGNWGLLQIRARATAAWTGTATVTATRGQTTKAFPVNLSGYASLTAANTFTASPQTIQATGPALVFDTTNAGFVDKWMANGCSGLSADTTRLYVGTGTTPCASALYYTASDDGSVYLGAPGRSFLVMDNSVLLSPANSFYGWTNLGRVANDSTNGHILLENGDGSTGVLADVSTDAVMAVKTRAGADTATVSANVVKATGLFVSSGTTPSVANVGANSCGTSAATIAGNDIAGVITVGATAGTQCRVAFTAAAPTVRICTVTDSTTTIATRATYVDTTHTDFLGAFVAGDSVSYICIAR